VTEMSPAEAIFFAALAKTDPSDRAAYLDEACGADSELRRRVDRLLAAHPKAGEFLEQGPVERNPTGAFLSQPVVAPPPDAALESNSPEQPGVVLAGRYQLLEQVGEGGMGTVWLAQQTEPVKRRVAVKLIKAGMDSKQVLASFEAERQALALMDHPHIAKVHDAGAAPDGRPFFVMELVKGVPITRYCDEHRLTPRQRLELFIPVCQAIQHAHQKGIIHRDVKPSNVLVARYDGQPVPKVIDFGVAKATGQQLTEQSLHTGFGAVVGTVEYMSPEQASFNQLDVDTRSDLYSLGVLLYELLVGSPPFTRKELEKAGMLEMLRVIREQEPSKPSTKLSTADGLPTLAANRRSPNRFTAVCSATSAATCLPTAPSWLVPWRCSAATWSTNRNLQTPSHCSAKPGRFANRASPTPGRPSTTRTCWA
jgi:serine/threonine protein kinase